jgi:hypothetical protein
MCIRLGYVAYYILLMLLAVLTRGARLGAIGPRWVLISEIDSHEMLCRLNNIASRCQSKVNLHPKRFSVRYWRV